MKLRIIVTLKNGVLDPQGKAIQHALAGLGFEGVEDVRAGKIFELELADSTSDEAGGFSYGDYLRCGAIAARSPVVQAVVAAADKGMPVIGICNGFQVLTETGLLPGALMRNASLNFVCRDVPLTVDNSQSIFTSAYRSGEAITIPVAHHDGNYFADAETLDRIEGEGRVAFRYAADINGSARNIAGVLNKAGNVLGMMPHPERRIEAAHGGTDGRRLFEGLLEAVA